MPRKLESFSPYLMALIPKAAVEPVRASCPSFDKAEKMRREFYRLRATLRHERHHFQLIAEGITVTHSKKSDTEHWVQFEPAGTDIEAILKGAGITLPGMDDLDTIIGIKE